MDKVDDVLAARARTHGQFEHHASAAQAMKQILRGSPSWERMSDEQREAAEMIVHKLGRIAAGDPFFADHWIDISGYAQLVVRDVAQ